MKRVLFISTSIDEQRQLEEVAQKHADADAFEFQTTSSFGQDPDWWVQARLNVVIVCLPDDDLLQSYYFLKMKKDIPRSLPMILLAPQLSQALLQLTSIFSKVRILRAPSDPALLYRSLIDITTEWAPGKQQAHPRYMTRQMIRVSVEGRPVRLQAVMKNLSVGGFYFEAPDSRVDLKPTDTIRIELQLPSGQKYDFGARIVWTRVLEEKEALGCGCTFTEMDEVYRQLLTAL